MRVAVITASIYDKERPYYTVLNKERLKFYCSLHNYHLYYVDKFITNSKCISFKHKWQGLHKMMQLVNEGNYDAYVWFDDDVFICSPLRKIEDFCNKTNKQMIFSRDLNWSAGGGYINLINSGVFILKNNNISKMFINKVWNMRNFTNYYSRVGGDQAIMSLILINELAEYCDILPVGDLETFPVKLNNKTNPLAIHFAGRAKRPFYNSILEENLYKTNPRVLINTILNNKNYKIYLRIANFVHKFTTV